MEDELPISNMACTEIITVREKKKMRQKEIIGGKERMKENSLLSCSQIKRQISYYS